MPATNPATTSPARPVPAALRVVTGPTGGLRAVFRLRTAYRGMRATVDGKPVRLLNRADVSRTDEAWSFTYDLTSELSAAKPARKSA